MNDIKQLHDLIPELIKELDGDGEEIIFTNRAKEIIREVAAFSRTTGIYKKCKEQCKEFWSEPKRRTAQIVYSYMIDRIANAPTVIHMYSSVVCHIPVLDDILSGNNTQEEAQ